LEWYQIATLDAENHMNYINATELAKALGVSRKTVYNWHKAKILGQKLNAKDINIPNIDDMPLKMALKAETTALKITEESRQKIRQLINRIDKLVAEAEDSLANAENLTPPEIKPLGDPTENVMPDEIKNLPLAENVQQVT